MAYKYCTATNWGKDFFTHQERRDFYLSGHAGDVWVVQEHQVVLVLFQLEVKLQQLLQEQKSL